MAAEFAQEEANHIAWIQGNLGEAAILMPQVSTAQLLAGLVQS